MWQSASRSTRPRPRKVEYDGDTIVWKPRGGMWTSSWLGPEEVSDWIRWCRAESFATEREYIWILEVRPDPNVVHIDTYEDLEKLYERFPGKLDYIDEPVVDWSAVSKVHDGVHVTEQGQWRTRMSNPLKLYGWDCESTVWFRWSFKRFRWAGKIDLIQDYPCECTHTRGLHRRERRCSECRCRKYRQHSGLWIKRNDDG